MTRWNLRRVDAGMGEHEYIMEMFGEYFAIFPSENNAKDVMEWNFAYRTNDVLNLLSDWVKEQRGNAVQLNPQCNAYAIEAYRLVQEKIEELREGKDGE